MKKNTYTCTLQNRLGALDRLLGALTHRGFLPEAFSATQDAPNGRLHVQFSFDCEEEKTVEKLVKFLANQVYVLQVSVLEAQQSPAAPQKPLALRPVPITTSEEERKHPYANHR